MNFSAVILAGGRSSRMGRDKAFLEIGGQTLLAHQIETVRAAGAVEVLISGRAGTDYSAFSCRVLNDGFPDAGPLAGIEAALAAAAHPLLLVLAVDLPAMRAELLHRLAAGCADNCGVIPRLHGRIEPLAALYPRSARARAETQIVNDDQAVRVFAERCVRAGWARFEALPAADAPGFANWNAPEHVIQPTVSTVSN